MMKKIILLLGIIVSCIVIKAQGTGAVMKISPYLVSPTGHLYNADLDFVRNGGNNSSIYKSDGTIYDRNYLTIGLMAGHNSLSAINLLLPLNAANNPFDINSGRITNITGLTTYGFYAPQCDNCTVIGANKFNLKDNYITVDNTVAKIAPGSNNTAVGAYTTMAGGSNITLLGYNASNTINTFADSSNFSGDRSTSNNNILIGANTVLSSDYSNTINIGNTIFAKNIPADGTTAPAANVGINTQIPTQALDITGNIKVRGTTSTINDGSDCTDEGTITYSGGNFYGCIYNGNNKIWKKLNN